MANIESIAAAKALGFGRPPAGSRIESLEDLRLWAREMERWAANLSQQLEIFSEIGITVSPTKYQVSNATPSRTFDAATVTTQELANVVAAVIEDTKI